MLLLRPPVNRVVGKVTYIREDSIENYLVSQWKMRMGPGARCDKTTVLARRGYPDRQCLAAYRIFVLAETKAPKGRLAAHQAREHARLQSLGFKVYVPFTKAQVDEMIDDVLRTA